jgi:hypothetical protein
MEQTYLQLRTLVLAGALLGLGPAVRAQNVGIGTTAPTQTLDVNGSLRVRGLSGTDQRLPIVQPDGTLGMSQPVSPVTVLASPTNLGNVTVTSPTGAAISGNYLYVTHTSPSELLVFDISNPILPVAVPAGTVAGGTTLDLLTVSGGYVYVCDINADNVRVYSLLPGTTPAGSPTAPAFLGTFATADQPDGAVVIGTNLFVASYGTNTVQVFNLTGAGGSLSAPPLLGAFSTLAGPGGLMASPDGRYLYVADYSANRLQVFDLNTGVLTPTLTTTITTGTRPNAVAVANNLLYLTNAASNTLFTYSLTTPATPVYQSSTPTGGTPYGFDVKGNYAYLTNTSSNQVRVLQLTQSNSLGFTSSGQLTSVPNSTFGDNLGSGVATGNVNLNGNYLVGGTLTTPGTSGVFVDPNGNVGIGTTVPRGKLDVASGDTYLVANANSGSSQSAFLPGHLLLAPYSGATGQAFIQGRIPNPAATTNIGLTLRTTSAGALLDALVIAPAGGLSTPYSLTMNSSDGDKIFLTNQGTLGSKIGHGAGWGVLNYAGPGNSTTTGYHAWYTTTGSAYAEQMRLTTAGLGLGNVGTLADKLDVAAGGLHVGGSSAINATTAVAQGAYLQWNRSANDGETWLLNHPGLGGANAGIRFGGIATSTGTVPTEWARFLSNGNFGIGATDPGSRLAVVAADNSTSAIANFQPLNLTQGVSITYNGIAKTGSNPTSDLTLDGKSTGNVLLHTNGSTGNVGIGTNTPIAKLHVNGAVSATPTGTKTYFNAGAGALSTDASTVARNVVAYFTGGQFFVNDYIISGGLNVSSDRRIKHVVGLSDRAADLNLLNKIRITDYTYIDQLANTNKVVKKVIAQEIQALMPVAVNTSTQAIPNVFEQATRVLTANGQVTVTTAKPHELPATGGRMRFYTKANQDVNVAVTVVDAHTVRFASAEAYTDLFVYGKYVDDFLSVDYDAIAMLNVSATQELARQVAELQQQNAALQSQATQAAADHASLLTLQAQMARLLGTTAPQEAQARR